MGSFAGGQDVPATADEGLGVYKRTVVHEIAPTRKREPPEMQGKRREGSVERGSLPGRAGRS